MEGEKISSKDNDTNINFIVPSKLKKGKMEISEGASGSISVNLEFKRLRCRKRLVALITNLVSNPILIEYYSDCSRVTIKCSRDIMQAVILYIVNPLINLHSSIISSKEPCEICFCFLLKSEDFFQNMNGCYHWILLQRAEEHMIHRYNWVNRYFIILLFFKAMSNSVIYFTKYGNLVSETTNFGISQIVEIERGGELFKILWGLLKRDDPMNNRHIMFTLISECLICLEKKSIFTLLCCGHSYCEDCYNRSKVNSKCFICKQKNNY